MRTKTINIYSFDELSEEAKEKAIEDYRSNGFDYFWGDDNENTLKEFEDIFPISVGRWEYGYHNFINFEMTCDDEISELKGIRLLKYLYNNYESILFQGEFKNTIENRIKHPRIKSKKLSNGKWFNSYHSAIFKSNCCVLTGYCLDDNILEPIYQFLKNPKDNINFEDLMKDCLESWIQACRNDYEYQQSNEYISEHLEANEYEFDEEGNRI
jgi:hypothetical protein